MRCWPIWGWSPCRGGGRLPAMDTKGSAYTYRPRTRGPSPLRVVLGLLLALALAAGLYWWVGRLDPVPVWLPLPADAKLVDSRWAPDVASQTGSVQYYLRIVLPDPPREAAAKLGEQLSGAAVRVSRQAEREDLLTRGTWPSWVQDRLAKVDDVSKGWAIICEQGADKFHIHAWPNTRGGSTVEMVQEGPPWRQVPQPDESAQ
jgi:hypothetical protein